MSKYYKAEDVFQVIDKVFQNATEEVIEAIKRVNLVIEINNLPTIEVSEDCISKHDIWKIIEDNAYWVRYNESNLFDICGNCARSRYLQDEPYGDTYISGWYCDEWLSLVDYDDTCDKWKEEA